MAKPALAIEQRPLDTAGRVANSRIPSAVQNGLTHQYLPVALAILAMALTLPSLWQGWVGDDLIHRRLLLTFPLPTVLKGFYVFVNPNKNLQITDLDTDLGTMPWWTLDTLRISFFRPLGALTHWFDYQLWPDSSALMHAHSILWYGVGCALALLVYRRLMGAIWVAGLAALLIAVDIVHLGSVAWLANRSELLAVFFGLLVLIIHDRWRREGWRPGAWLAPLSLALSLLSAESGVAMAAYLAAYAVFLDRGTRRGRLGSLIPYAAVVVIWRLVYQYLGYGTIGSGFYVDPGREPLSFAAAVLERGPVLLLTQWIGLVPTVFILLSAPAARILGLIALLLMIWLLIALGPLIREDRMARFWTLAMILAIVPTSTMSYLRARIPVFVGLGAMGLMAQFISGLFDRSDWLPVSRVWRRLAWVLCLLLIALHAVLAPMLKPFLVNMPAVVQSIVTRVTDIGPLPEAGKQDVVIVNAPSAFYFIYAPSVREMQNQPMPAHIRILAPGYSAVEVTRLDAHTLAVRPERGYLALSDAGVGENQRELPFLSYAYLYPHLDTFFRSNTFPMALGQQVELTGMRAEVTALTADGRPAEARMRFTQSLEHPSLKWLQWDWEKGAYVPFKLPEVGETVQIPGPF